MNTKSTSTRNFGLILAAIALQIVLGFSFYLSSFAVNEQNQSGTQVTLFLKKQEFTPVYKDGKIQLEYEINIIEDFNGGLDVQNYFVGDTVYISLYNYGNESTYSGISKEKPSKSANRGFLDGARDLFVTIKGEVREVISPKDSTSKLVPVPAPLNENYYSSSSSSFSYNSSPKYDSYPEPYYISNSSSTYSDYYSSSSYYDPYNSSSSSSGYYDYSGGFSSSFGYAPNYYKYKIVYGIEEYSLDQKYVAEYNNIINPKAEVIIDKNGKGTLKSVLSDNKKWPQ